MNSDELRALIARGPFSQRSAAYMLGVHEREMRHYCAATMPIPRIVEFALHYCVEHPNDPRVRKFIRTDDPGAGRSSGPASSAKEHYSEDPGDPTTW